MAHTYHPAAPLCYGFTLGIAFPSPYFLSGRDEETTGRARATQMGLSDCQHMIVFIGPRYGIFHVAEFAVLAGLHLTTLPPGLGSSHDILARFGLGP